ncbi:MAG: hypothetical protein JO089_03940, partial [Alphaproteobacteria bacterium]|nr:hypothetical protein [Alphaproteobacteria bacterium]
MSIHRFTPPSSVSRIVFRYANDRPPVALVSAGRTNPAELWSVRRALEGMGWECVPARAEGRLGLQVQGFKDEGQLVAFLQQNHFVSAAASVTPEPGDHPSRTVAEWLEDKSMKICGWSYIIGDVSLLLSGLMSGRSKETLTGLLYTAGGAVLARYGNIKTAEHVRGVSERLGEYIQEQGATLPEECGLFSVLKEKREGMLPTIDRFLARYPSQTTISIYSLGSLTML